MLHRQTMLLSPIARLIWLLPLVGCFDAESMVEARRAVAIKARLEEVDLGEFRVTLPRPPETNEVAEISFHVFGHVANRDLRMVQDALETHGPELRHKLLLATRQLGMEEIEDPQLQSLRNYVAEVINETLPGDPLQFVGFYRFSFSNL